MVPKKILFCTDFSKNSEPAKEAALEYAKAFGASIQIIHVIGAWPVHAYRQKVSIPEHETVHCIEHPVNADLEIIADEFRKEVKEVRTCTRAGEPAHEISRLAEEEQVDLIVMGTHGWAGLRSMLIGSVTEKVVPMAHCPVLVVRSFPHPASG